MTFVYAKAFALWMVCFPLLCLFNAVKALVDFLVWLFDLPTNVWEMCFAISNGKHLKDGVRKDGGNI